MVSCQEIIFRTALEGTVLIFNTLMDCMMEPGSPAGMPASTALLVHFSAFVWKHASSSGVLKTGTTVTPTHNNFSSYHHVIITRKVARPSKNS